MEKTSNLKGLSEFFIGLFVFFLIFGILSVLVITSDSVNDLGVSVVLMFCLIASLFLLPTFISGIFGLRYCLKKNSKRLTMCWIFGIIALLINICFIFIWNKDVNFGIYNIFLFLIFIFPHILYLFYCYKEKEYYK